MTGDQPSGRNPKTGSASLDVSRACREPQASAEAGMYTCKDSVNLLLDFLDGELPEDDARHLRMHLDGSPPCVDFMETYRATPGLCKKALAAKMPTAVASKLAEFLRQKCKP